MPYPMSHLYISETLLKKLKPNNIPQYYLGSLAPDAVHFRKDYTISHKRISHLYENLDRENLDAFIKNWKSNVENFFNNNSSKEIYDFVLGYCIHLIADIYNYKYIWTPFKLKFGGENDKIYQNECLTVDFEIFQKENYNAKLFPILDKSEKMEFLDLVIKEELIELKNNIINIQYVNKEPVTNRENKFMTYEKMKEYNIDIVKYVEDEFSIVKGII